MDILELDDENGRASLRPSARPRAVSSSSPKAPMTVSVVALADVPGKTIVLVGTLTPAWFTEGDAALNLDMAFSAQVASPGTFVPLSKIGASG